MSVERKDRNNLINKESKAITFWKEECGYTEDNAPFDEILKNSDGVLENVKISVTNCYSETLFAEIKFRTLRLYKGETFYCLYKCAYNFFERYKDKIDKQPNVITWLGMEDEFVCLSHFNKKKNRKEVRFFNDNLCYYISFSCQSEGNE